jgi:hypothetical protein
MAEHTLVASRLATLERQLAHLRTYYWQHEHIADQETEVMSLRAQSSGYKLIAMILSSSHIDDSRAFAVTYAIRDHINEYQNLQRTLVSLRGRVRAAGSTAPLARSDQTRPTTVAEAVAKSRLLKEVWKREIGALQDLLDEWFAAQMGKSAESLGWPSPLGC